MASRSGYGHGGPGHGLAVDRAARVKDGERTARRAGADQAVQHGEHVTGARIEHAVDLAVLIVALRLQRRVDQVLLAGRQEVVIPLHDQLRPHLRDRELIPVQGRRAREDAVEVRRIALRLRQPLAPARRAAVPERVVRPGAVMIVDHHLRRGRQRGNSMIPAAMSELVSRLGPAVQATANEIGAR